MSSLPLRRPLLGVHLCGIWCCTRVAAFRVHHPERCVPACKGMDVQEERVPLLPIRVSTGRVLFQLRNTWKAMAHLFLLIVYATLSTSWIWCGYGSSLGQLCSLSARISSQWVGPLLPVHHYECMGDRD